MKKALPFFACISVVILSCSHKYYTSSFFDQQTANHKTVAILPAEMIFTGKQPENLSTDDLTRMEEVKRLLCKAPGVVVIDDPATQKYPMPMDAHEKDEVFVGRLRRDETQPRTLNMWIVSDNLRKGAATNAVQIAEYLLARKLLG